METWHFLPPCVCMLETSLLAISFPQLLICKETQNCFCPGPREGMERDGGKPLANSISSASSQHATTSRVPREPLELLAATTHLRASLSAGGASWWSNPLSPSETSGVHRDLEIKGLRKVPGGRASVSTFWLFG